MKLAIVAFAFANDKSPGCASRQILQNSTLSAMGVGCIVGIIVATGAAVVGAGVGGGPVVT